uniref:CUB domain-containing protein n=1 Tax=Heterorhabditis bacteriophora TaxID=37862 RepID=A0A1I7X9U3_HETBA
MLETNQYMIVSQHRCQTTFETDVIDRQCPRAFLTPPRSSSKSPISCESSVRVHLIRDPSGIRQPKIMFIGSEQTGKTVLFIEDVKFPPRSTHENRSSVLYRDIDFSRRSHLIYLDQSFKHTTEFTVFDADHQWLYVLTRDAHGVQHCTIYYAQNLFNNDERVMFLYMYSFSLHRMNGARADWIEDIYLKEVYYTTQNGELVTLHALPIHRLMSALLEGTTGRTVFTYNGNQRSFLSVSGGALLSRNEQNEYVTIYMRSLANMTQNGISCGFSRDTRFGHAKPTSIPVLIIRDWDFCQIRDGAFADRSSCAMERRNWKIQEGLLVEQSGFAVKCLTGAVIFLTSVNLFLIVYVCWIRRSMDDSFEKECNAPLPYYPNSPGQYPDMDVSVDRWNY